MRITLVLLTQLHFLHTFSIMCIINNNVLFAALVPPFARVIPRDAASGSGR